MAFLVQYPRAGKVAAVLGTGILVVAIACHILCLATPFYFILSHSDARAVLAREGLNKTGSEENITYGIHFGLWVICAENVTGDDLCHHVISALHDADMRNLGAPDKDEAIICPHWLIAPRALSIVGLLMAAFGVFSFVAFVLTTMEKWPHLFLFTATGACIVGGILIIGGDIAFAERSTVAFYANYTNDQYFFPTLDSKIVANLAQQYDNRITAGWSFILDVISGALCIVSGPIFAFIALRLKWNKVVKDTETLNKASRSHKSEMANRV